MENGLSKFWNLLNRDGWIGVLDFQTFWRILKESVEETVTNCNQLKLVSQKTSL